MKTRLVIAGIGVLLTACAHHPADKPHTALYDAFQKYCVVTGGQREAVAKAATADGFALHQGVLQGVFQIDSTTWQKGQDTITIGPGHRYKVGPDGQKLPWPYDPPETKVDMCSVRIMAERDDSEAAFARWAGVPPLKQDNPTQWGDQINDKYRFRREGGRSVTVATEDETQAILRGGFWFLLVYRRDREYGATLTHYHLPDASP